MFIGNHYRKNNKIYLDQVTNYLYLGINESARLDNEVIFRKLVLFLRSKLYDAQFKGSLSAYSSFITLPLRHYPFLNKKYKNLLIDLLSIRYRESAIGTSFRIRRGEDVDYEKQLLLLEINYDFGLLRPGSWLLS